MLINEYMYIYIYRYIYIYIERKYSIKIRYAKISYTYISGYIYICVRMLCKINHFQYNNKYVDPKMKLKKEK